jgi:hypothetical protein
MEDKNEAKKPVITPPEKVIPPENIPEATGDEPPEIPLTPEEELDIIPEEDELTTPPYEEPPAGEGP